MGSEKKKKIIMTIIKAVSMIGVVAIISSVIIHKLESKKEASRNTDLIMRNDVQKEKPELDEENGPRESEEADEEKDPVYSANRQTSKNDEWEYYIEDGSAVVVRYLGKMPDSIRIPNKINSYNVTAFTAGVYFYNKTIEEITIPGNIKEIPENAFEGCKNLKTIDLPDSVTKINANAFKGCSSITSFTIGQYIEEIDMSAFADCPSLSEIKVNPHNSVFISHKGAVYSKDMTTLLKVPSAVSGIFTIADNVFTIGNYAFAGCNDLTGIKFPYSLKTIQSFGIYKCDKLSKINIGKNVSKIEPDAFYGCSGIKRFAVHKFNNSYRSQDGMLINDAKDRIVLYPTGKKEENYTIPENITYISSNAFTFENLKNLIIPDTVEMVDDYAFEGDENCTIKINQREELFKNRSGFNWKKYFKGKIFFLN